MRGDEFDLCFLRKMRERTSDVPAKKYFNNQTSHNKSIDISEMRYILNINVTEYVFSKEICL